MGLSPEQWVRAKDLFAEALGRPPETRAAFLESACAGDPALRGEVGSLLAAHEQASGAAFLEQPAAAARPATPGGPLSGAAVVVPGRRVGPYEVVEELGRGGMGVVVKAVRADDAYRKAVAIKLVPEAGLSSQARQRFLEERQILAGLEHPNIARLLDGGTTEDGLPFLVMELVEGEPIDTYCDRRRLGVDARLRLFLMVAAAVHHAHRNLVVHRDLKPANIFVTPEGTPKLLDFGIARLIEAGGGRMTFTAAHPLTPLYASPEQLRGEPLGTGTDVYSLGVVLHELLTGIRPRRPGGAIRGEASAEVLAAAAGWEPEPPSTSVDRGQGEADPLAAPEELARARGYTPRALRARLRGDLDTIVLTALRDDPAQRYGSAEAFADDLRRHLDGRPVRARPPTLRYRAGKFVRRNPGLVAAVTAAVLALGLGMVATTWQARRADAERRVATRRFADVRRLAHALLFEVHDAVAPLAGATAARELLVRRGLEYLDDLARETSDDRSLEVELARAYRRVGDLQGGTFMANEGDLPGALASYRKAVALLEGGGGPRGAEEVSALAEVLRALSSAEAMSGDAAGARQDAARALALARGAMTAGPQARAATRAEREALARALFSVGFAAFQAGDLGAARAAQAEAVSLLEGLHAEQPADAVLAGLLAGGHWSLGGTLWTEERLGEAVPHYQRSRELQEGLLRDAPQAGQTRRQLAYTVEALASLEASTGQPQTAVALARRAVELRGALSQGDPRNADARVSLLGAQRLLAFALAAARKSEEAARLMATVTPAVAAELAREPADAHLRILAAEGHEVWSDIHRLRAEGARGTARLDHLEAERQSLQRALALWRALEAEGRLNPFDRRTYESAAEQLAGCERALARASP